MKVIDMFSGLGGWSQAFLDRGHKVLRIDNDSKFDPDMVADIMAISPGDLPRDFLDPDVILASPPCNCFSVMTISRYWDENGRPKNDRCRSSISLVGHTVKLILQLAPRYWIIENPRGMMRRVLGAPAVTTYFASWGEFVLKPTDLWGVLPDVKFENPLKWQRASRSEKKGIQAMASPELRAKIPYALSEAVCLACEKETD